MEGGVPFYLPQYRKDHDSADRLRSSYLPLFPGYVFFRATGAQRLLALRSNVIVTTLEVADQPLLEAELESLWRLQQSGACLVPHPYLGPGDRVRITDGPFKGLTGTVLREKGQLWLVVSVTLLRRAVAAELERSALEPARETAPARRTAAAWT
jgi:transcriptional antiterminator RfaH